MELDKVYGVGQSLLVLDKVYGVGQSLWCWTKSRSLWCWTKTCTSKDQLFASLLMLMLDWTAWHVQTNWPVFYYNYWVNLSITDWNPYWL